jgi:hypothetical protein
MRVFGTETGGLRLLGCPNTDDSFAPHVELEPRGSEYVLEQVATEQCTDFCTSGVSTGCTVYCPTGRSCDATLVIFKGDVDFERRRFYLEITTHAEVQIPNGGTDQCDADFARGGAMQMPCSQVEELEADWLPNRSDGSF